DFVQRDQRADRLCGKSRSFGDQYLVGLLDYRAVATAQVLRSTRLQPDARHDVDRQLDKMWEVGIELDEVTFGDLTCPCRSLQAACRIELSLRGVEEFLQHRHSCLFFSEHAPGGNLTDVRRSEIDSVLEAILQLR